MIIMLKVKNFNNFLKLRPELFRPVKTKFCFCGQPAFCIEGTFFFCFTSFIFCNECCIRSTKIITNLLNLDIFLIRLLLFFRSRLWLNDQVSRVFWYNYDILFLFLILLIIIIPLMCNFLFILTCPCSLCSPWQAGHYSNQMSTSLHSSPLQQYYNMYSGQPTLTGVSKASWQAAMRGGQMTIILSMSNVDNIIRYPALDSLTATLS